MTKSIQTELPIMPTGGNSWADIIVQCAPKNLRAVKLPRGSTI